MLADVRFGSRPCENFNARRARRNISEKLRVMRTDNAADIRLGAVLENCIFYISPMYEFSHSLGHSRPGRASSRSSHVRYAPKATIGHLGAECRDVPIPEVTFTIRQFLHLAAGAGALPALSRIARGQTYPSRPVRWIIGFDPD